MSIIKINKPEPVIGDWYYDINTQETKTYVDASWTANTVNNIGIGGGNNIGIGGGGSGSWVVSTSVGGFNGISLSVNTPEQFMAIVMLYDQGVLISGHPFFLITELQDLFNNRSNYSEIELFAKSSDIISIHS